MQSAPYTQDLCCLAVVLLASKKENVEKPRRSQVGDLFG